MEVSKAHNTLAKSALALAQNRKGVSGTSSLETLGPEENYTAALIETMTHFVEACPVPLDPVAFEKIIFFFDLTIGCLIESGEMGWIHEYTRRPFVLECVDFLGAAAFTEARHNGSFLTGRNLDHAACSMMHAKQDRCPLPPNATNLEILGSCCIRLATEIGCQLKKMGTPAMAGVT